MKFPVRKLLPLAGGVTVFVVLLLAAQVLFVSTAAAQDVNELQRVIETQQKQLEMQQEQLQLQQKQLDEQMQLMQKLQSQVKTIAEDSKATAQALVLAEESRASGSVPADKVVTSGEERVKLSVSGWVNRMVSIIDDGKDNEAYFVDNDNSESRVNFVGTAKIDDDLTLGSRIELTIAPNKAGSVDQTNQESGDSFEQRWTEVSLDSKRFGKLSLGRGFTASFGIASSDLSGTMVIATSTIVDLAPAMFFRQKSDDSLTDLRIGGAFSDFNGLARKNRLRYDSPKFYGAHFAVSAISEQRSDAGLYWGGQGYGFKAAASAGVADLNEADKGLQYAGSASILHEDTGLNLSLSAGMLEYDDRSDGTNVFVKAGWLTNPLSVGSTAFSVDYTQNDNFAAENDDGYSVGVAAVQQFDKYGTDLYALYRLYSLDRDLEPEVHDIGVVSIGARVKF